MNAVRWEGAWRFSIFLAFLLLHLRHSNALNISIDGPYTPYRSSDDRYDFVDVAQQQSEISQQSATGQTSQFYTTGDVDETFWLKELGDDFKNAIHMQVGGEDRHNGIFNMSENGSAYKVQQIVPIDRTVTQNEIQMPKERQGKQRKRNKIENNDGKKRQRKLKQGKSSEKIEKAIEKKSNGTANAEKTDKRAEENNSETTSQHKHLNENENENEHEDLKKYTKFQHIHIKYAPEHISKDTQKTPTPHNQTLAAQTMEEQSPVVVNLPETSNVVELDTNDAPVVVKMPPVIYHSKPANLTAPDSTPTEEQQKLNKNTQTTETQKQHENNKDAEIQIDIDNTQYKQQTYTPMTYEQQQQYNQQQHHTQYDQQYSQSLQYTNFQKQSQQQQQQHTTYPVQIPPTQYQAQQSIPYNENEQQQQQYSPATSHFHNSVSSAYHHNHGVYPPADISSASPMYPSLPTNVLATPTRNAKLRYSLSKPAILTAPAAAYGAYDAPQSQTEYNRERRSTRQLYQEGL